MHEFSLAQGLHDQMVLLARENEADKVVKAEVAVGEDAGIVVESFSFGFGVLRETSPLTKECELVITKSEGKDLMLMRLEFA